MCPPKRCDCVSTEEVWLCAHPRVVVVCTGRPCPYWPEWGADKDAGRCVRGGVAVGLLCPLVGSKAFRSVLVKLVASKQEVDYRFGGYELLQKCGDCLLPLYRRSPE